MSFFLLCGRASARSPENPDGFSAGLYADETRTAHCVTGPEESIFDIYAWGFVPQEKGLTYATLRLVFPGSIDISERPEFNALVTDVIMIDYEDGTVEWTMLFSGCPSGWIWLFRQRALILDETISRIEIRADNSMMRDCGFVLNGILVSGGLAVNDPACGTVPVEARSWGAVKQLLRRNR
jgi:hypothetical protein